VREGCGASSRLAPEAAPFLFNSAECHHDAPRVLRKTEGSRLWLLVALLPAGACRCPAHPTPPPFLTDDDSARAAGNKRREAAERRSELAIHATAHQEDRTMERFSIACLLISLPLMTSLCASSAAAQATDVDCPGCVDAGDIALGAVRTARIANHAVNTSKLADGAVTADQLAFGAVGTARIADRAVSTSKLADGAVTTTQLAFGAVGTARLGAGAVTTSRIRNGAVTAMKIAGGSGSGVDADTVDGFHAFELLGGGIAGGITTVIRSSYSDSNPSTPWFSDLVTASCLPLVEELTGGGCQCFGEDTNTFTTNAGTVWACIPAGNSYIGECYAGFSDADLGDSGPGITVYVLCAPSAFGAAGFSAEQETSRRDAGGNAVDIAGSSPDQEAQDAIDDLRQRVENLNRKLEMRLGERGQGTTSK